MQGNIDHIFFYGTLMRTFPLRARAGIDDWLEYVGSGRVAGVLFDLGSYPGLVVDSTELIRLKIIALRLRAKANTFDRV